MTGDDDWLRLQLECAPPITAEQARRVAAILFGSVADDSAELRRLADEIESAGAA